MHIVISFCTLSLAVHSHLGAWQPLMYVRGTCAFQALYSVWVNQWSGWSAVLYGFYTARGIHIGKGGPPPMLKSLPC